MTYENFTSWLVTSSGAKIILIVIVTWIVYIIAKNTVKNILKVAITKSFYRTSKDARLERRINTITIVISKTILVILIFIAIVMILAELSINIVPILTGAGVVGLAIGFGAKNLVQDLISGFFILIEDQFAKGDTVEIAQKTGKVVDINLRRTILRDDEGYEHIIPNGEIKTAINKTKNWARVNLEIPVSSDTNIDKTCAIINSTIVELIKDENFSDIIIEPPTCLAPEKFADKKMIFRINGKVKAQEKEKLTRLLFAKIKAALEKKKIKLN